MNEQNQQIEMLANQAIADADALAKVYATAFHRRLAADMKAIQTSSVQQMCQVFSSRDSMIISVIDEYATDQPLNVELPKIETSKPRDLLPAVKIKHQPSTRASI